MFLIIIVIIAIYAVSFAWTWHNLGAIDKLKKIAVIIIGNIIMYIITIIIFNISKSGIDYNNVELQTAVSNTIVSIFTGINGIIVIPQIAKILEKIKENEIDRNLASKRFAIILIVFILCIIFECGYIKDTQKGILNIYNSIK